MAETVAEDDKAANAAALARQLDAELSERKLARAFAIGLPSITLVVGVAAAVTFGAPAAILVFTAGGLLGVIGLFWTSLRILSGDASLPPEIEALDATAHAIDALASRKTMLLRALKDVENEHALGKIDDDDYADITATFRADIKEVMARIDQSLEPHRARASLLLRERLATAGLADKPAVAKALEKADPIPAKDEAPKRLECPKCKISNEPDAKFCKGCATTLTPQEETSGES